AMEWAAGNLLEKDWPLDNEPLRAKAETHLRELVKDLRAEKRGDEANRLLAVADHLRERDLYVKLTWQTTEGDAAALDLEVNEPAGTVCSTRYRQTPGGGTLIGGLLDSRKGEEI